MSKKKKVRKSIMMLQVEQMMQQVRMSSKLNQFMKGENLVEKSLRKKVKNLRKMIRKERV